MLNILVLLCGGTIGSRSEHGKISLAEGGTLSVIENYNKTHSGVSFTVKDASPISSEEIDDKFYLLLINFFKSFDLSGFDGVIITHGTDTLSFTAPLFSFACRDVRIPVIFVSASYVPDDVRSNAHRNFGDAVSIIKNGIKGIFSVSDGEAVFAPRLCEADWLSNRFTSFDGTPILNVENDKITVNNRELLKAVNEFQAKGIPINSLDNKILLITPYPGIDYSCFDLSAVSAVLHMTYHSATASSNGLKLFIEKCRSLGKNFYIAPIKTGDMYDSTAKILEYGAIPMYKISHEAALAKLKIAYNCDGEQRGEILNSNLYFEHI
ncbi:MAG: asparaginase [Oscillospiraceae bacterium]|nr:asparaginase [Oscillospiraceae bacterium]